jgi:hypothetical protein
MGLGNLFVKSVTKEIGRNVGKGLSNDMFGDWHSTPIRATVKTAQKQGWDIGYVEPSEYDVSRQPQWKPHYGFFGSFFVNALLSLFLIPIFILPFFSIKDFIRSKTPLYARIPMRRKDGRTKAGFKEIGHTYVQLKSKRLLTDVEKRNSKIAGILEILGIIVGIIVWDFIMTDNALDFSFWTDSWNNKAATP